MTEHVHEWKLFRSDHGLPYGFVCKLAINTSGVECDAELTIEQVESRLNATEGLKQFTRDEWDWVLEYLPDDNPQYDALRNCLDILEGRPFTGGTVGTYFDTSRPEEK